MHVHLHVCEHEGQHVYICGYVCVAVLVRVVYVCGFGCHAHLCLCVSVSV